ncbi:ABC transporter ATP-binding protein [Flavobacterium sp. 3-210]
MGNKNDNTDLRPKEFWAVRDINFELRRGECLGLIGHNGAGKSTLLKILNGLINPDEGKVTMRGRIGALIELGAGFNPILTGRENIYNNGAILGFSKNEINSKIEEIIDFAEIHEFIDMPVQNYSSGMKVRLGFAIAAQMEPDVLIIDEVLAVGDLGFVLKCFKRIDQLIPNTAIIFVSHSMPMISRISNQIILMDHGVVDFQGFDVAKGVNKYYGKFVNNSESVLIDDKVIENFEFKIEANNNTIDWGDDFLFTISFENIRLAKMPYFSISLFDKENKPVALMYYKEELKEIDKGKFVLDFCHKKMQLSRGVYSINVTVNESFNFHNIYRVNNVQQLFVNSDIEDHPTFFLDTYLMKIN